MASGVEGFSINTRPFLRLAKPYSFYPLEYELCIERHDGACSVVGHFFDLVRVIKQYLLISMNDKSFIYRPVAVSL